MNASTNHSGAAATAVAAAAAALAPPPAPPELQQEPCGGVFYPEDCAQDSPNAEDRFLLLIVLALAVIVVALCALACMLTVLVHKLSIIWVKSVSRPAPTTEPSDDPRKGLLQETKSSLRDASSSAKAEGKKKKASFAEDTSCAPPRDVDEEDL